ncbi:hypothetical protein JMA_22200 [Jeotgalibacillus malaysiensis]|uniref:Head-tail adaptor protein n=1 Tax=Jeotgalibacillus malaysiensis TaxID=1508404 RepID=A0A0B5AS69_9BACL|nr:phage head closure protein [Jeotgalibacillus malaysiensis]AJD91537.1 hypothetical protein JMA_22200 [Jeotgalibacillus malaysiensis]
MTNPGDFKQRLVFMQPTPKNSSGYRSAEKTEYLRSRAQLKTLKGNAFYTAASENNESNRRFIIRYRKELDIGVRPKGLTVFWKGIEHEIESIENDDGLNKTMTVFAKAVS